MPRYVMLIRFSDEGMRTIKDGPARLEQARETLRSQGAELKDFYLTLGEYDAVAVVEAPDDQAVARTSLAIGARGTSRSQTLRAFSEEEYRKIVESLP